MGCNSAFKELKSFGFHINEEMACSVREYELFRKALLHGMRVILWSVFCLHLHVLLYNVSSNGPWIKQTKIVWLP